MKKKGSFFSRVNPYLLVSIITISSCAKQDLIDINSTSGLQENVAMTTTTTSTLKIEAENYTNMKGIVLDNCSEGGKNVGGIQAGDWIEYTVNVPTTGNYNINFRVAGPGGKFEFRTTTSLLATINTPKTQGYQTYTTVSANVNLTAGQQKLTILAVTGGYNINWFELLSETIITNEPVTESTASTTKIEAENYISMKGVVLDVCSEGGKNVGGIQAGDYMDYKVNVSTAGSYKFDFRIAGPGGKFELKNAAGAVLATINTPATGGYQAWATTSVNANLAAGDQTLRIFAVTGGYNLNWFEITGGATSITNPPTSGDTNPTAPTTGGGATSSTISPNIIYHENFEGSTYWDGGLGKEWNTSYGFTAVTSPVIQGSKAGRFELRDGDADSYYRSEVRWPSTVNGADRWFAFSVYWPSNGMKADSKPELFHQTHQTSKTSPPMSMLIKNDKIWAEINGQVFSGTLGSGTTQTIDLGLVPKDQWVRFVIHYRFSYNSDGAWQIWQNGKQILNHAGKTIYPPAITTSLPSFKLGIYKWPWSGTGSSDANLRIMHVDDVRIGNEKSTYSEM